MSLVRGCPVLGVIHGHHWRVEHKHRVRTITVPTLVWFPPSRQCCMVIQQVRTQCWYYLNGANAIENCAAHSAHFGVQVLPFFSCRQQLSSICLVSCEPLLIVPQAPFPFYLTSSHACTHIWALGHCPGKSFLGFPSPLFWAGVPLFCMLYPPLPWLLVFSLGELREHFHLASCAKVHGSQILGAFISQKACPLPHIWQRF